MKIFETPRLLLREFADNDSEFIFSLLNSPGWLKYIGDRGIRTIGDAQNYIQERLVQSYNKNGFGLYMVELKPELIPVGMCGLVRREGLTDTDIGFALLPGFEKKGLANEAALATIQYVKDILKLERLVAITVPENLQSISLLKKLRFSFEKMIQLPGDKEELMLFVLNLR